MSSADRPVFNDRYEIHSRIGRGGMADVFLARDRLLDRPVAIKVLFPEYANDPSFVERFRREATAASNLAHPNIVGVYDFGKQGSTYYIVMEYVNGRTLADILRSDGSVMPQRAADIASDVAAALGFAHRNGVVHRDVKPANILVSPTGAVKVADFGIARALNSSTEHDLTQAGAVMGTATYFSPEQAQGGVPDPRSDLYSLGIVMYEMAAGRPPFTGDNPVAIAYKQVHDTPRPLSAVKPDVPRAYEAITMKLLAKNPTGRYPSAEDLRADLRRFRDGQPVAALAAASVGATTAAMTRPVVAPTQAVAYQQTRAMPQQGVPVTPPTVVYQDQTEPPSRNGWYIAGAVLALLLLAIGAVLLFRALNDDSNGGTVEVADFTNQTLQEAEAAVRAAGLQPVPDPQPREGIAENVVYAQSPGAGQIAEEDSTVTLTYNPAPAQVALPNLVGQDVAAATATLAGLGMPAPDVVQQVSDSAPVGQVTAQNPAPGQVAVTTKVQLTVSSGRGTTNVPNVLGQDQSAAAATLGQAGFGVSTVAEASEQVAQGKVIRTDPAPNTPLEKGQTVTMVVSSGAPQVDVPNVVGQTESEARNALQAAGFLQATSNVDVQFGSNQAGRVVSQSPQGGMAAKGSTVTIIIGRELPPPTTTVPPTTTTQATTTTAATTTTTDN